MVVVAGFAINNYVLSNRVSGEVMDVTDVISTYPVDTFDFKQTLQEYARHLCYKNDAALAHANVGVYECIDNHDKRKNACNHKVFRLAPLTLEEQREVVNYAQQYIQCTLPYKSIKG